MKRKSTWLSGLVGAGLLAGCAAPPPAASVMETQVVPFAKIRDAADSADGYYTLGRELQRRGKFEDAERAYRQALDIEPGHADARNGLAAVAVNRGDIDIAISILGSLAASHPDQPHLLANLGYAHYLKGNYFDARVALEQAAGLDPANNRTREKLQLVLKKLGVPETDAPSGSEELQLVLDLPPASSSSDIVAVGPGVYQLQAVGSNSPSGAAAAAPLPQVLVPVASGMQEGVSSSRVAELTPSTESPMASVTAIASTPAAKLEIVNGNGIPRLARKLRHLVQGNDWTVVRVANHSNFNVSMTRIEYAHGNRGSAENLARGLQVAPVYRHNDALGDRIRVVLGYDFRSVDALRPRASVENIAAAE